MSDKVFELLMKEAKSLVDDAKKDLKDAEELLEKIKREMSGQEKEDVKI